MSAERTVRQRDWVGHFWSYTLAWGLPSALLIGALFIEPLARTFLWTAGLLWMGGACLANARRCGRIHCHFTGPFFLLMALASALHGSDILALGPRGWLWLGLAIVLGTGLLWYLPERIWGRFRSARMTRS